MAKHMPILASSKTAAQLLDLKEGEFLKLVAAGLLPQARDIGGGNLRWSVDDLKRIHDGEAAMGDDYKWG